VGLKNARQANDAATEAEAVRLAAELFMALGDYSRGLALARRALELVGHAPAHHRLRALSLKTLGVILRRSGDIEAAISAYLEALPLAQEVNDRVLTAQLYNNLGVTSDVAGRYEDSLRYSEQGLAIDQEIGHRTGIGTKLGNIGQVYLRLGDYTRALEYLRQAQQIHEALEEKGGLADTLTYLAWVTLRLGAPKDARAYAERAVEVARKGKLLYFVGHGLIVLAECLLAAGSATERQRAQELALEAARIGEASPMPDVHAAGLQLAARAYAQAGDRAAALASIDRALEIVKAHPHIDFVEEVYLHHARLFRGVDDKAAQASLAFAVALVHSRAARISDPAKRRTFLALASNQEILSMAAKDPGAR
jgi:tetratricopeptide (TPR) repeat protein